MLKTITDVALVRATDPERGNVQLFLERLMLEVAAANYRHFLGELQLKARVAVDNPQTVCRPPLVANERQVSGLFATALNAICPVSRPEQAIDRKKRRTKRSKQSSGRVDFVASYGARDLGLELKCCPISSIRDATDRRVLNHHWKVVRQQAEEALAHMRADSDSYAHPVAIGLLVIRVSRLVTKNRKPQDVRATALDALPVIVDSVRKTWRPDFLAYYVPPIEMQFSAGWGKAKSQYKVFPGFVFAAVVPGNLARR